jgi:hypothetical protein
MRLDDDEEPSNPINIVKPDLKPNEIEQLRKKEIIKRRKAVGPLI